MACNHKYGAAYPDSSQSSGYAKECGLCGAVIEAEEGDTCEHNWVATEDVGFSSGYGYVCTMCGELGEELDPQPSHSHTYHSDGVVPPTCTEPGYTNYSCVCGETIKDDYTPALGHNWVAERNDGFSSGYGYVCSRPGCGELGEELTCIHSNRSEVDGSRVEPTCTENGFVSYICETCGHIWQETLYAAGHTAGEWKELERATCTASGKRYQFCSVCAEEINTETIPALGHKYGDPYYSKEFSSGYGQKCEDCGDLQDIVPPHVPDEPDEPHSHIWQVASTIPPSCTEPGYTSYSCSCGTTKTGDPVEALGHTPGAWIEDKAATCTASGSRHQICSECGETVKTETIKAIGHSYGAPYYSNEFLSGYGKKCVHCDNLVELDPPVTECQHTFALNKVVAATCEVGGYSLYICSKCKAQEQRDVTPALGHTEGVWVEDKAATCATNGAKHQVCAVCGKTIKTDTIPALGHAWGAPYFSDTFSSGYGRKCSRCGELEKLSPPADAGEELLIEKKTLMAIADAVRARTGGTETMTATEIPEKIGGMIENDPNVPDWAKKPNPPTAAEVGAAPAGFGLGTVGAMIDDPDNVSKSGFYQFVSDQLSGSLVNWYLLSQHHNEAYANQIAIHVMYGYEMRRTKTDYTWNPWEWVDPPMALGVEYRTTERWQGKPVYVKAVDLGLLASSTTKYIDIGVSAANVVESKFYVAGNPMKTLPIISYENGAVQAIAWLQSAQAIVRTFITFTNYNLMLVVKYTKD